MPGPRERRAWKVSKRGNAWRGSSRRIRRRKRMSPRWRSSHSAWQEMEWAPRRAPKRDIYDRELSSPLRFDRLGAGLAVDRNRPGLHRLGYLAFQRDMQQTVFQIRAADLYEVGELEATLESTRGNALVKNFAAVFRAVGFLAGNGQGVLVQLDVEIIRPETGNGHGDAILIIADALDVIGRIGGGLECRHVIEHTGKPVKPNG